MNTTQGIPAPAGAVTVTEWVGPAADGTDEGVRYFKGTPRVITHSESRATTEVMVAGTQYGDGRIQRRVVIDRDYDTALTAADARRLAVTLLKAADEADDGGSPGADLAGLDEDQAARATELFNNCYNAMAEVSVLLDEIASLGSGQNPVEPEGTE